MGISISFDRVLELEDWIATTVCEQFELDGIVSPACHMKGLFTIGAMDNLDHNPTSTTFLSSFHGTVISLFQFPTSDNPGDERPPLTLSSSQTRMHHFPDSYAIFPPIALKLLMLLSQRLM